MEFFVGEEIETMNKNTSLENDLNHIRSKYHKNHGKMQFFDLKPAFYLPNYPFQLFVPNISRLCRLWIDKKTEFKNSIHFTKKK